MRRLWTIMGMLLLAATSTWLASPAQGAIECGPSTLYSSYTDGQGLGWICMFSNGKYFWYSVGVLPEDVPEDEFHEGHIVYDGQLWWKLVLVDGELRWVQITNPFQPGGGEPVEEDPTRMCRDGVSGGVHPCTDCPSEEPI